MAGSSVTFSHRGVNEPIKALVVDWVSDSATGAASGSTQLLGRLERLVTDPGAVAPDANYDITLVDSNGFDVLQGVGANRHTSTTEQALIVYSGTSAHPIVYDTVTFTIANAGNSKAGQAVIYYVGA